MEKPPYPCFEELVVHLQESRQLHSDLQHGGGDEADVPVQPTHFLFQKPDEELCKTRDTLAPPGENVPETHLIDSPRLRKINVSLRREDMFKQADCDKRTIRGRV